jgi:hypothetical protein
MEEHCELLKICGFFKKYEKDWSFACKGMIQEYCTGSKMNECKRKEYRKQHGAPPSDDMTPSGTMLSFSKR